MVGYKAHYRRSLEAEPGRLHFAAHSHHLWPDCTRDAHLAYWDDTARLADEKWGYLFGEVISKAKRHVAHVLELSDPDQLCIVPNTHEAVARLLSCFRPAETIRILTTDSEFHSFDRQIRRFEELSGVTVERLAVLPHESFQERLMDAVSRERYELIYLSQVFFNSGLSIPDLESFVQAVQDPNTVIVVDGYHAFCAVPTSLRNVEARIFYLGGGYKYAQSGEGACFLHVPAGCTLRPMDTGWFASFSTLESERDARVAYPINGDRFAGATFDCSGLYRFNAVMDWWTRCAISVDGVHAHVQAIKENFMRRLEDAQLRNIRAEQVIKSAGNLPVGHFLTLRSAAAMTISRELAEARIIVDARDDRLRFGFGLYHDEAMLDALFERLAERGF